MSYSELFNGYPADLEITQIEAYNEALARLDRSVELEEDCWIPKEDANDRITLFGQYKTLQQVALILNGPIQDETRSSRKIVTMCSHKNCCNPEHLYLVNKRYDEDEIFRIIMEADHHTWSEFRKIVQRLEYLRTTKLQELEKCLALSGIRPDIRAEYLAQYNHLKKRDDYAYLEAVKFILYDEEHVVLCDKFMAALKLKGLAVQWAKLPTESRRAITNLMREDHPYSTDEYLELVLTCVGELYDNDAVRRLAGEWSTSV